MSGDVLGLLHWNVHSWRDTSGAPNAGAVTALIRDTAPDVVSLVEVNERWGAPDVLAGIAGDLGYHWIFAPSIEFGADPAARGFGNALLTRRPALAAQQLNVFTPQRRYDGTEPNETRSVIVARVPFAGDSMWAGSTHFPATHRSSRTIAARALTGLIRQLSTPWIICGDFNAAPAALFSGCDGLLRVWPRTDTPTFPAHRPRAPIDYILTSPGLDVAAQVLDVAGSDHLPVLATVTTTT